MIIMIKLAAVPILQFFNIVQKGGGAQKQISSLEVVKFLSATNRAKSTATPGYSSREARSDSVKQKFDNGIVVVADRVRQNCVSKMELIIIIDIHPMIQRWS